MTEINFQTQNITLVYDALTQDDIDPRIIKRLFDGQVIVNDFPEFSIFVWPELKIILQIGDRRFRITKQESGNIPCNLWEATNKVNQLVNKKAIALGYNFDATVNCEMSSADISRRIFHEDIDRLTETLSGELVAFVPRFKIAKDRLVYDFTVDASDNPDFTFLFHINAHQDNPDHEDFARLEQSFVHELQHIGDMISKFIKLGCD